MYAAQMASMTWPCDNSTSLWGQYLRAGLSTISLPKAGHKSNKIIRTQALGWYATRSFFLGFIIVEIWVHKSGGMLVLQTKVKCSFLKHCRNSFFYLHKSQITFSSIIFLSHKIDTDNACQNTGKLRKNKVWELALSMCFKWEIFDVPSLKATPICKYK